MNKTIYITEKQLSSINGLLLENEGTNMKKARKYLESKGYTDPEKRQQILDAIRTDVPNSRLQQCKFLLGVTRLYLDGELNNGNAIFELNKTLKYIASDAHVNEYDYNLNGETLQTLVNRFKSVSNDDLKQSIAKSNSKQLVVNNNYTIVPIDNPDEASKYGKYTSWCVTHSPDMYNSYTNNGIGRFYFCLRKGFKNEPVVKGDNCPLDNYGLSMIAVSVNFDGSVNTVTCRWNHDNGGNDSIMNIDELEDLLGRNFYQTFKPYSREELHAKGVILFDEVQGLLDSGKKPEEIFERVDDFNEGYAIVQLNNKCNFINTEGKIISDQWFDGIGYFTGGLTIVRLNGKYNFINTEGNFISDQWFDDTGYFFEGFCSVKLNGKWNFIDREGKIIFNQWFDYVGDFEHGFAKVKLNGKWNFIDREGKIIFNQWFDYVGSFSEGVARVELNGKYNFINTESNFISNQWFDDNTDFNDGFGKVKLKGKWNLINAEGKFLSDQWFDGIGYFYNGLSKVKLNGKWNFIDTEGKIIFNQWFDEISFFNDGFAKVLLNGKQYKINTNGEIINESKTKKTIIITEKQKKKLKKAIAAQDQVGGKVNAGIMDGVVGMCEDATDDMYHLSPEKGDISPYYHVNEAKKKVIKNDKGEIVPEKCDKCGGKVVCQIHGEPVYICKECGKYFGTVPFKMPTNESKLNESWEDLEDIYEEHGCYDLLSEFNYDINHNIKQKRWNLIPAQQYHTLLQRFMENPTMARIPYNIVHNWFMNIIVPNAIDIESITNLAGHSSYFPVDDVSDFFDNEDIVDFRTGSDYLDSLGFYDWCKLPDGSDGWSDYGIQPLFKIINSYTPNTSAEDILILINRCLDVAHQRGDLASAFIEGGKSSCNYISNGIRENVENEITSDEVDLSSFNIKKQLNPKFWQNGHLDSRIRLKLLDIADDFVDYLDVDWVKPKDIIMTGSLANFNWDGKYSDIDLHIMMDFSDVDENVDFVNKYFISKKSLWNDDHKDLNIYGFPVELYVQDVNEKHSSSGVYSLDKDKWIIEPEREKLATSKVNKNYIKEKVSDYINEIDKLIYLYNKNKNSKYKIRKISQKAEKLWDEIKNLRKIGFEKTGGKEISNFNIIFKTLRRLEYLDKLYKLKTKSYDILGSL